MKSLNALNSTDVIVLFATNVASVYLLSWVILHEQFVGVRVISPAFHPISRKTYVRRLTFTDCGGDSGRHGNRPSSVHGRHNGVKDARQRGAGGSLWCLLRRVPCYVPQNDGRPAASRSHRVHIHNHRDHQRGHALAGLSDSVLLERGEDASRNVNLHGADDCQHAAAQFSHSDAVQRRCHIPDVCDARADHVGSGVSV